MLYPDKRAGGGETRNGGKKRKLLLQEMLRASARILFSFQTLPVALSRVLMLRGAERVGWGGYRGPDG